MYRLATTNIHLCLVSPRIGMKLLIRVKAQTELYTDPNPSLFLTCSKQSVKIVTTWVGESQPTSCHKHCQPKRGVVLLHSYLSDFQEEHWLSVHKIHKLWLHEWRSHNQPHVSQSLKHKHCQQKRGVVLLHSYLSNFQEEHWLSVHVIYKSLIKFTLPTN